MHFTWLLVFAFTAAGATIQKSGNAEQEAHRQYQDAQVFRVQIVSDKQKDLLLELELDGKIDILKWLKKHAVDILVSSTWAESVKNQLIEEKAAFEVMIPDVQELIKKNTVLPIQRSTNIASTKDFNTSYYHRLNDILSYLDYLADEFPTTCTVRTIGYSVHNRPIKMLRIAGSSTKSARQSIVIEGGIHAREWISPAAVLYVIKELCENRAEYPFASSDVDFYFIPVANPDGYVHSHSKDRFWRKNRRNSRKRCPGVDLNRNFGFKWGGLGSSNDKCDETYRGIEAFSEPESRAIKKFVSNIRNAKAYVAFHSYGESILYPWGYDEKYVDDWADLDRVGKEMKRNIEEAGGPSYVVGNSGMLYPAAGASDDWAKGSAKIKYVYTVELRDGGTYGFLLPPDQIEPTGVDALMVVRTLAEELINGKK